MGDLSSPLCAGLSYRNGTCADSSVFVQFQAVKLTGSNTYAACATTDSDADVAGICLIDRNPGDPRTVPICPLFATPAIPLLADGSGVITAGSASVGWLTLSSTVAGRWAPAAEGAGIIRAVSSAAAVQDGLVIGMGVPGDGGAPTTVTLQAAYDGGQTVVETAGGAAPIALSTADAAANLVTLASSGTGSGGALRASTGTLIVQATREINILAGDGSASDGYEAHVYAGEGVGASRAGGDVLINAGDAGESGNAAGGNVKLIGGSNVGSGAFGYVQMITDNSLNQIKVGSTSTEGFITMDVDGQNRILANSGGTSLLSPDGINTVTVGNDYVELTLDNTVDGVVRFTADASGNVSLKPTTAKATTIDSNGGGSRVYIDNNFAQLKNGSAELRIETGHIQILGIDGARLWGSNTAARQSWFGAAVVVQQAVAALTNNITAGGTSNQLDDWTSLAVYATDAAAIRNAVYQCGRSIGLMRTAMANYGLVA